MKFYRFPKEEKRCKDWISKVNRVGPRDSIWNPSKAAKLCSEHFIGGAKSDDPNNPSYLPTLFANGKSQNQKRADRARSERCQRRLQERASLMSHDESGDLDNADYMVSHLDSAYDNVAEWEGNSESVDVSSDNEGKLKQEEVNSQFPEGNIVDKDTFEESGKEGDRSYAAKRTEETEGGIHCILHPLIFSRVLTQHGPSCDSFL